MYSYMYYAVCRYGVTQYILRLFTREYRLGGGLVQGGFLDLYINLT